MSIVIRRAELEPLPGPFEILLTVRSADTGGRIAALEETLPVGAFITPHTHSNDVWVHVLRGRIGVLVDAEIAEPGPGDWALKPRNVPHAMWNCGQEPARIIEVLTPAGSEDWFAQMAASPPENTDAFDALADQYGIRFDHDSSWIPIIKERYGL
jgi:quercetin dioxygenase-like cupin family protein